MRCPLSRSADVHSSAESIEHSRHMMPMLGKSTLHKQNSLRDMCTSLQDFTKVSILIFPLSQSRKRPQTKSQLLSIPKNFNPLSNQKYKKKDISVLVQPPVSKISSARSNLPLYPSSQNQDDQDTFESSKIIPSLTCTPLIS